MTFIQSGIGMGFYGLGYHFGSSSERPGSRGTSHLMEHLICKTFDDLLATITRNGIDYNAYTADDRVVFWFQGLNESLQAVLPLLETRILGLSPLWTPEQFENEKKTVLQEYADNFNDPVFGCYSNLLRQHYEDFGPIGEKKDLLAFTYEESLNAGQAFKTPNQIVQVGATPFTGLTVPGELPLRVPRQLIFSQDHHTPLEVVPSEDKTVVCLMGNHPVDSSLMAKISLTQDCLNNGLESPLYQEIREKRGLSYFSYGFMETIGRDTFPVFFSCTTNDRVQELVDVYQTFFQKEFKDLVTRERFNDCQMDLKISQKKKKVLPHSGWGPELLKAHDRYAGAVDMSFDEAIALAGEYFTLDKLHLDR